MRSRSSLIMTTALLALAIPSSAQDAYLLTNVDVVPMDTKRVLEDHDILVVGARIAWMGPVGEAPERAATTIDGGGGYVIPGLIDMHVHLRGGDDELDLYLLKGVTTVVNMSGTPNDLELRERVASGALRGPTIHTAGRTIDGDPPRNSRFIAAGSAERAAEIVEEQIADGYEFIKIYDLIEHDAYRGAVEAAKAHGRAVAGHIPKPIGLEGILDGHDLIVHAEEYYYTFFDFQPTESRLAEAAQLTAEAGIAVTPNTAMIRSIIDQAEDLDAVLSSRPGIRYLPPATLMSFLPEGNRYVGRSAEWLARNKVMYPFLLKLTRALHEAGVAIVAGSDAGVSGAEQGFSMIREIRDLEKAGLSRFDALRAATANSGRWLHENLDTEVENGVVERGRPADLVVLGANPLDDLDALDDIRGIFLRGEWIEHETILSDVEARARTYAVAMRPYYEIKDHVAAGRWEEAGTLIGASELIDEGFMNNMGYYYLGQGDTDTAIRVFTLNVEAYPESSNVWDSLGEAYMEAGEIEPAIENYEKSLELDPGNTNAVEMIEKMKSGGA